jgi:hypothetical protein
MTSRIHWIQNNPYACILPFSNYGINLEFNGTRNLALAHTWLRESCCCHLDADKSGFDDVRQSVITDQSNARCHKCYHSEKTLGSSERTMALLDLGDKEFKDFVSNKTSASLNFGIKFSNLCNLSCRSCSPTFSTKYAEVHGIQVPADLTKDLSTNNEVWQKITNGLKNYLDQGKIINLNLFGGESLIQPGVDRLCNWLEQNNLMSKINLGVTTNLTKINKLNNFVNFKNINIFASIDSVQENYEYVRYPARWEHIQKNLDCLVEFIHKDHVSFTIQPLFSLNNIFYLTQILDFWHNWISFHRLEKIVLKNVSMYRPFHLTLQNLPLHYRHYLCKEIEKNLTHDLFALGRHQELHEFLLGVHKFSLSEISDINQFEIYLFDTAKHDLATNSQMQKGNKNLFEMLNKQDKDKLCAFQANLNINNLEPKQKQQYLNNPL